METVWIEIVKQLPFAGAIIWVVFQLLRGFAAERELMMKFYAEQQKMQLESLEKRDEKLEAVILMNTEAIRDNTVVLGETKATMMLLKQSLNGARPE